MGSTTEFGNQVQQWRKEAKVSIKDMSKAMDCKQSELISMESGELSGSFFRDHCYAFQMLSRVARIPVLDYYPELLAPALNSDGEMCYFFWIEDGLADCFKEPAPVGV